jgi:cytidylate kinase
MSVITISRGTFSGGKMLAECLAARLGYRCVDRDTIVEKAAVPSVSQEALRDALEKPPSFLDRFKHKKYIYLTLLQAALAEEVRAGKVVYHGNAGHLLLKGGTPVLRTRIIAPMEFRVQMAIERLNLTRNEALAYIERVDQDRRKWTNYLYGVDWGDPALYDIVINLEYLSVDEACDTLAHVVKKRCFEFSEQCQATMNDLAVASRIKANLILNPSTEALEIEIVAHNGLVTIKGKLSNLDQFREVERIARAVPGVKALNMDGLAPSALD